MRLLFPFISVLLISGLCVTCKPKETKHKETEKSYVSQLDSAGKWLLNPKNYNDPKYFSTFLTRYQSQIASKDYKQAAISLIILGDVTDKRLIYDGKFLEAALDFLHQYEDKLDATEYAKLCYYIGSQYSFKNSLDSSTQWVVKSISTPLPTYDDGKMEQGFGRILLGINADLKGDMLEAEKRYLEALSFFEDLNNKTNQATVLLNL